MYVVVFGLTPYFSDLLLKHLKLRQMSVICFDEALNKVVQKGQLDLVVHFCNDYCHKVSTQYLTSVFLQIATAEDLYQKFKEAMFSFISCKIITSIYGWANCKSPFSEKTARRN